MNHEDLNYFEGRFRDVKEHTTQEIKNHIANPCKNSAEVKEMVASHKLTDHKGLTLWQVVTTVVTFLGGLIAVVLALRSVDKGG